VIRKALKGGRVTKKTNEQEPLTPEELEAQNGEELPDREAMSLINPGVDGIASTAPFEPLPEGD
jgi:hypothetical protein